MEEQTKAELDEYLRECVRIDPHSLNDEFVRLPADYAFFNEKYRTALERSLLADAAVKRMRAGLYITSSEAVMPSGKPATVGYIEALVERDPDYAQAASEAIYAEADVAHVKGVLEAIRTKRDMIIQMGATVRQELQNDPAVRDRARTDRMARGG